MGYLRFLPLKEIYSQNILNYKVSDIVEIKDLIKLLDKLGIILYGKVSIKLHSGEDGNKNYVKP